MFTQEIKRIIDFWFLVCHNNKPKPDSNRCWFDVMWNQHFPSLSILCVKSNAILYKYILYITKLHDGT